MKNILLSIAAFLLSGLNISASVAQETPRQAVPVPQVTDQWRFSVTPYLWLLNVNGQVDYRDNPILNSRIGTAELLSKLQFGAMAVAGCTDSAKKTSAAPPVPTPAALATPQAPVSPPATQPSAAAPATAALPAASGQ